MKGDFTRDTFDPTRHYSRVLMQQGRVQLDADWNEQSAIFTHFLRALARDLIGPYGAPAGSLGFQLVNDITKVVTGDGKPLVDPVSGTPTDQGKYNELTAGLKRGALIANPGIYYVDGIRVEATVPVLYPPSADPQSPAPEIAPDSLIYLDVWERHITCIEDPCIREVALGGPDTTTRAQIVWRIASAPFADNTENPCDPTVIPQQAGNGRLRARARHDTGDMGPCAIPATASYRGAENQLYRVEIVIGGSIAGGDAPTFVWSRENGSVVYPIASIDSSGQQITVTSLGRDQKLALKAGDWVSVVDDDVELIGQVEPPLQVKSVAPDTMIVTLLSATSVRDSGTHKLLRRWDAKPVAVVEYSDDATGLADKNWIALEDGVEIWFASGGTYAVGDYWLIPARVATGDVEWPRDDSKAPLALPPRGVRHHYAPLGYVDGNGTPHANPGCRQCFGRAASPCPAMAGNTSAKTPVKSTLVKKTPVKKAPVRKRAAPG